MALCREDRMAMLKLDLESCQAQESQADRVANDFRISPVCHHSSRHCAH